MNNKRHDDLDQPSYSAIAKIALFILFILMMFELMGCTTIENSTGSKVNIIIFGGDGMTDRLEPKPVLEYK